MIHQISDREYHKLGQILDAFAELTSYEYDCVVGDHNNEYINLVDGRKVFRIRREDVNPDIEPEEAAKRIDFFTERSI